MPIMVSVAPVSPWEEVYGPDYPLTPGDVPVLENAICRLRWLPVETCFALDTFVSTDWVEQARLSMAGLDGADVPNPHTSLIAVSVEEWTPELGVLRVRLGGGAAHRIDTYISLGRGWTGPRLELYGTWSDPGKPGVALRIVPATAGEITVTDSGGDVTSPNGSWDGQDLGSFAGLAPWAAILPQAPALALHLTVLQTTARLVGRDDSAAYAAARRAIDVLTRNTDGVPLGYLSATLGHGPRASVAADAADLGKRNLYDVRAVPTLVAK